MASMEGERLALRVMIAAALLGVAAGFLPALSAIRGAAARSGRAAPLAPCVAARRPAPAAQPVRLRAHAHAAPPAPVRGISGSPAGPWTRLKQVAIGLLAAVSLWRGSGRWLRLHGARASPASFVRAPGPPLPEGRDKKGPRGPGPRQLIALSCRLLPLPCAAQLDGCADVLPPGAGCRGSAQSFGAAADPLAGMGGVAAVHACTGSALREKTKDQSKEHRQGRHTAARVFRRHLGVDLRWLSCVSQVIEVVSADMKDAITSRKGLRLVMAAASKDKTAEVDAASVFE